MRLTSRPRFLAMAAILVAVAAAWTIVGSAQQRGAAPAAPPQRSVVTVTQIKPDMLATYQDLVKNTLLPAVKKAQLASYLWTFTNGPSGQGFTFIAMRPIANYAQLDQTNVLQRAMGEAAAASYNAKVRATIVSQHTYIQTARQDLSIQSNATTPPALGVVQIFQVAPGKGNDFTASMTSDWLPAFRKAGVKDFWAFAQNFGGPAGQIVTVRPIAKFAELDEPGILNKAGLSAEAIAPIVARRNAVATVIENNLVRFVPDLSFGMPGKP